MDKISANATTWTKIKKAFRERIGLDLTERNIKKYLKYTLSDINSFRTWVSLRKLKWPGLLKKDLFLKVICLNKSDFVKCPVLKSSKEISIEASIEALWGLKVINWYRKQKGVEPITFKELNVLVYASPESLEQLVSAR